MIIFLLMIWSAPVCMTMPSLNPSITINYQLSTINKVRASVYDTNGNQVEELLNTEMNAGIHTLTWNVNGMPSGVYIVTMVVGNTVQSQKIVLMK